MRHLYRCTAFSHAMQDWQPLQCLPSTIDFCHSINPQCRTVLLQSPEPKIWNTSWPVSWFRLWALDLLDWLMLCVCVWNKSESQEWCATLHKENLCHHVRADQEELTLETDSSWDWVDPRIAKMHFKLTQNENCEIIMHLGASQGLCRCVWGTSAEVQDSDEWHSHPVLQWLFVNGNGEVATAPSVGVAFIPIVAVGIAAVSACMCPFWCACERLKRLDNLSALDDPITSNNAASRIRVSLRARSSQVSSPKGKETQTELITAMNASGEQTPCVCSPNKIDKVLLENEF